MQSNCPRRDHYKIFKHRKANFLRHGKQAAATNQQGRLRVTWGFQMLKSISMFPFQVSGLHFFLIGVLNEISTGLCNAITIKAVFNF